MNEGSVKYQGDGFVAYRYGDRYGDWDTSAPARITNIVLGHDVDTRTSSMSERALDFVQPDKLFWDPSRNSANLLIKDPKSGRRMSLALGQWLVRLDSGEFTVTSHNAILEEVSGSKPALSLEDQLADILETQWVSTRKTKLSSKAAARYLLRSLADLSDYLSESAL